LIVVGTGAALELVGVAVVFVVVGLGVGLGYGQIGKGKIGIIGMGMIIPPMRRSVAPAEELVGLQSNVVTSMSMPFNVCVVLDTTLPAAQAEGKIPASRTARAWGE
jgi:hypothetical protein